MLNAGDPKQRAAGDRLVGQLLANGFELARRMGLQEIIWNGRIWSATKASQGLRQYRPGRGGSMHRDHVHLGMNHAGAAKTTTFWKS